MRPENAAQFARHLLRWIDQARPPKPDENALASVLIRPDGTAAWASSPGPADTVTLTAALRTWLLPT
ncbi:hypothetical protein [Nonomuraea sp. NPDC049784]|uniref:aromatic-ring hydroxylase C-terminal domain-containing protein n=1 Tax=Nonomuraea sp. NPDC049784 TaxID=3154361 RepID=UPI0033E0A243